MMKKSDILIAILMSFLWVAFSGIYVYKSNNLIIWGINVFPLVMWISGLIALRFIYDIVLYNHQDKFLLMVAIYWFLLLGIEYVGYNIAGIQLASNYEGIFGLKALHVPAYAKIYYLMAGPLYIYSTELVRRVRLWKKM